MFDDDALFTDEDNEMEKAIEKYETMLKNHEATYFDSEEFEYIIDHYTQHNQLKNSRQAVEIAIS